MRLFKCIVAWFVTKYRDRPVAKFKIEFVADFPFRIANKTIFIVQEGDKPETLIFKCPCGCNADIYLNLLKDSKPRWKYTLTGKSQITISPSVWRTTGCKSHFHIHNGKLVWAYRNENH